MYGLTDQCFLDHIFEEIRMSILMSHVNIKLNLVLLLGHFI